MARSVMAWLTSAVHHEVDEWSKRWRLKLIQAKAASCRSVPMPMLAGGEPTRGQGCACAVRGEVRMRSQNFEAAAAPVRGRGVDSGFRVSTPGGDEWMAACMPCVPSRLVSPARVVERRGELWPHVGWSEGWVKVKLSTTASEMAKTLVQGREGHNHPVTTATCHRSHQSLVWKIPTTRNKTNAP